MTSRLKHGAANNNTLQKSLSPWADHRSLLTTTLSFIKTTVTMAGALRSSALLAFTVLLSHQVQAGWEMLSPEYAAAVPQPGYDKRQAPPGNTGPRTVIDAGYGANRSRIVPLYINVWTDI